MHHPHDRRLTRPDLAILAAFALLGAWLSIATDREYMGGHGRSPARVSDTTRLPDWIKERRHEAIRFVHGGTALLTVIGLGLAAVVLRPRRGGRRPGPFGPGAIAAILTGGFALWLAARWALEWAVPEITRRSYSSALAYLDFYSTWREQRPLVTWMIVGAWCTLLATGRWRRTADSADRLGRWLGIGWLLLIVGQAAIWVIAWY